MDTTLGVIAKQRKQSSRYREVIWIDREVVVIENGKPDDLTRSAKVVLAVKKVGSTCLDRSQARKKNLRWGGMGLVLLSPLT